MDFDKTIEILKQQCKSNAEQEEYFKTMKLKSLGAIEVLEQLQLKAEDKKEDKK